MAKHLPNDPHNRDASNLMLLSDAEHRARESDRVSVQSSSPAKYEEDSQNLIKFARQNDEPNIARIKLVFVNNSRRQVGWRIKATNDVITATPSGNGLIHAFQSSDCTLIWQRPPSLTNWHEVPKLKLMLSVKLIVAETGKVVGETNAKFNAVVDMETICTADDPPIFKMVLNSEKTLLKPKKHKRPVVQKAKQEVAAHEQKATPEKPTNMATATQVPAPSAADDNSTTYLLYTFLGCLLCALLIRLLS